MFKLPKTRPDKSGNRVDFRFSQIKVLQVPKGWERLFLSVVSVETGKIVAKTGKVLVRNGVCQWSEILTESIWVLQKEASEKMEDCFLKFVVGAGSGRSGVLGEATVNMTGYMSSSVAVPVSVALRKGNHGTTLQVKIQCLNPRTKQRNDKSSKVGSEDQGEPEIKESSFSTSASNDSYDSAGSSMERQNFSSEHGLSSNNNNNDDSIRQDEPSESDNSAFDSLTASENKSCSITDSSKDLLEAAEETIQELSAEAKMWKTNAEKLTLVNSAANAERDVLRKEVERLLVCLEDSNDAQKELENEIKLGKESISDLSVQLQKSQDENVSLVSVLQELEETIEKQKLEIENLSSSQTQFRQLQESENNLRSKIELLEQALKEKGAEIEEQYRSKLLDKESEIVELKHKLCELERDCDELTDENLDLLLKLKDMKSNCARGTSEFSSGELECSISSTVSEESEHEQVKRKVPGDDQYIQKLENLKMQMEVEVRELHEDLDQKRAEIERLEANLVLKEETEMRLSELQHEKEEFLQQVSGLEAQIRDLEEKRDSNVELNEKCAALETKLVQSEKGFADCSKKVEVLEEKLSLVMQNSVAKEKELGALLDKNRELEEKLRIQESTYNQMFLKKRDELENLRQEIENLTRELNELCHEEENLQEESDRKLQCLMKELPVSREKQEMLRASEEKLKTKLNDLEQKLSVSEFERKQLTEANNRYKVRLNRLSSDDRKSRNEGDIVTRERERYKRTISSLEAELKDIRQRYLEMSLKYAEVESQREELVMKLKGKKNIKRWFSHPSN